jgi:superfamily II DNA or RNA helicase
VSGDFTWPNGLDLDVEFGYLDPSVVAPKRHNPLVVLNTEGTSVLRTLREELGKAESFLFSVAFVTPRAIALLKQELVDFAGVGRIVTSNYLSFNSPAAFLELLNLRQLNVDIRIHPAQAFHPKGYVFAQADSVTAMMGSSNLTENALVKNHEWNLKVSASPESDLGVQLADLVQRQLDEATPLTEEWIASYAESYTPPPVRPDRVGPADDPVGGDEIVANAMQEAALGSIAAVRAAGHDKAIVISATGTGKTMLSALDVRAVDPIRLLFVVHREQILDRTIAEYRRVLGGNDRDYGKLTGSVKQGNRRYVFATVQTLSQADVLGAFGPTAFDYVIIDEAHRSASPSHRRVMEHFKPEFMLGMTATPERTDGFNVFELFDFNVPYEIRLNHALEEEMLTPFHYYGVADLTYADGRTTTDETELQVLVSPERVDHLVRALEIYGHAGVPSRGLIFCARREEATELSEALNHRTLRGRQLRTVALTGEHSVSHREEQVEALERGELDYILSVDVFNEGVDIPTINQVVMLRQTQSAIVFVQQLGRGLRKARGKDYLVVIDFIGNYANNFLIPIALFGDESLDKESLREHLIAAEESGVLPGLSSVRFDRIAQERVLRSISDVRLDSLHNIKKSIDLLRNRLGRFPALVDFLRFESVDPVLAATKLKSYPALLERLFKTYDAELSPAARQTLELLSHEVLTAKRLHEQALVRLLLTRRTMTVTEVESELVLLGIPTTSRQVTSAVDTLTLARHAEADLKRYGSGIARRDGDRVSLAAGVIAEYAAGGTFQAAVDDLLDTAQQLVTDRFDPREPFTPGRQYSRKETTRLLTMPRKWTSTLYGYKADRESMTCPIFVTLHKASDVTASTAYADALLDRHTMLWYTKSNRRLDSPLEAAIIAGEFDLHVFVKKDDAEGKDSYYLGRATASDPEQTTMPGKHGEPLDVVRMLLRFEKPIESTLFDYFHPTITA